jgi:hypothetical protein
VEDASGSLLPGARIEITCGDAVFSSTADDQGEFRAEGLPGGPYRLHVAADGFAVQDASGEILPDEQRSLPPISLKPTREHASVTVTASVHDIAAAQVSEAEQQRVLGVIPNFYVVYFQRPARLGPGQKFHLALRSTIDPVNLALTGVSAGISQASDQFSGYGQGAAGYGRRYGAAFADGAISTFLGGAIYPALFHQDPRYYYQGRGSTASRVRHAIGSVVVTHGDNGRRQFNISGILGNFSAAAISNAYYPESDRNGAGLTMRNATIGTAFGALGALMQEFVVPHFTPHTPGRAKADPGR